MKTYFIPAVNLATVENKLGKLYKRAQKLGFAFEFEIGQPEIKKVAVYLPNGQVDLLNSPAFVECYPVTVPDVQVYIGGHSVIGKMEMIGGQNVIFGNVPDQYRDMDNYHCEHCNTNRPEKHLFIIQNNETNQTLSVGRGCLADYTDTTNAEQYASWFQDIQLIDRMMEENANDNSGKRDHILLEKFFYCVMEVFKKNGFVKSGEQNSTKDKAWDLMVSKDLEFGKAELAVAKNAIAEIVNYLNTKKPLNDFEWNVWSYVGGTFNAEEDYSPLHVGMIGTVSASILLLDKAMETEVSGEFVGQVGNRMDFELTFVNTKFMCQTQFGAMWIETFVDSNNNVFVWKTTTVKNFVEGQVYKIKATIKGHETYNMVNQNVLTRLKVI